MRRHLAFLLCVVFIGLTALGKDESPAARRESGVGEPVVASSVEKGTASEKAVEPDLVFSGKHASASTTQPSAAAGAAGTNWFDLVRVPLALAFVVLLILGTKWLMRRGGVGNTQSSSAGITVLSRTVLPPKQQVLLLKVGRRVLVTWSNGSEMGLLSEVSDPEEVCELVGRVHEQKSGSATQSFGSLFSRAEKGFEDIPADEKLLEREDGESASGDEKIASDVSGLRQQIQSLRQRFQG